MMGTKIRNFAPLPRDVSLEDLVPKDNFYRRLEALTSGNRNDVTQLLPLVDGIRPVAGKVGRPRQRPDRIVADRGYDHDSYRRELWRRGVKPVIARRGTEHGLGLGRWRWVYERTPAWLSRCRRLCVSYEHRADIHEAFLDLCCALICLSYLRHVF